MNWRSWWIYLVVERMGYRRPSPVTPEDISRREAFERREVELEDRVLALSKLASALTPLHRRERR